MVFRPTTVVPACLGVLLLVPAGAFGAGPASNPQVLVVFQNVARAPARMVEAAQTEVSRLFKDIGVEIVWTVAMPADYRNVRMLALTHLEPSTNAVSGAVLGFTQTVPEGRGTRAYVVSLTADKLLAVAMAHELGHTLLPDASHAAKGIIRAPWDDFDLRAASKCRLHFSDESAVLIRRRAGGDDGPRRPAEAAAQPVAGQVRVAVQNELAPPQLLGQAQDEVKRLFSLIDVDVVWATGPLEETRGVRVVKITNWEPADRRISPDALGITYSGERGTRALT